MEMRHLPKTYMPPRITMAPLYTLHPQPFNVMFGDLNNYAEAQTEVLIGTPGSLRERAKPGGGTYYVRQYYDCNGKVCDQYISSPVGDSAADAAADEVQIRIEETNQIVADVRVLRRQGFQVADAKTYATVASLHNHGVFRAGGVLIGSHAFGVLLNAVGARGTPYFTEDVDLARNEQLAFPSMPRRSLLEILLDSGIRFTEVPSFDTRKPSTSFKQPGRSKFQVDLLVPSPDETFPVIPVPELRAHATGLPYLRYLLGESQTAPLLAREGCCLVRVPLPERFAVHKLIVSQLRVGRNAKSQKDVTQACTLLALLGDLYPGAIEAAVAAVPMRARHYLNRALAFAQPLLQDDHLRAWEALQPNS
jgi:hypothetical protein